jgi:DNA-binding NtrC family response regulator
MIEQKTILYISDGGNNSNSVAAAIKETGCEVVSTKSPTEGVALLYIMGHVDAVVLDNRVREHASFDVAQSLRRIRPGVPLMLECGDQIDDSPTEKESCVSTEDLTSAIEHLLTAEAVV